MRRSDINKQLKRSVKFFKSRGFHLPAWATWSPDQWRGRAQAAREIVECRLGWDITDFGSNDFDRIGLINFNLRNGVPGAARKAYCEKIIIVGEQQVTPLHTHRQKREDIINRGGGDLVLELRNSQDFTINDEPVTAVIDGFARQVPAGGKVVLKPGESIFLEPGTFHLFYGRRGGSRVLVGEVSSVNDDETDNLFAEGNPRFPSIEEDEAPLFLLVNDYARYLA